MNGESAQGQCVALVVEQQVVHLAGQGKQAAARSVGVCLVDIDFGVGQGLVELRHGGGVIVVAVGEEDIVHLTVHPL